MMVKHLPPLPPYPGYQQKELVMLMDGSLMYMPSEPPKDELAASFYWGMSEMMDNYLQALRLLHGKSQHGWEDHQLKQWAVKKTQLAGEE